MKLLPEAAAPGVGERAAEAAEAACHLHDAVGPGRWSREAAEDALEVIETTAQALATAHPAAPGALAPVYAAVAGLRHSLGLPPPAPGLPGGAPVLPPRMLGNPRRSRLHGPKPGPAA
ncbi:hypothetical protein LG634_13030 [Streptomyces bambusae]|uniref:hypothetical protein n=1 Tax=Streptomyces bambusae TaxID=1550616 RepID=UPI001CFC853D|nr:hypothetical protein [Streptomyces bambusae]MCB5165756.1 hypothetical protein [Streptomyces bambusae]